MLGGRHGGASAPRPRHRHAGRPRRFRRRGARDRGPRPPAAARPRGGGGAGTIGAHGRRPRRRGRDGGTGPRGVPPGGRELGQGVRVRPRPPPGGCAPHGGPPVRQLGRKSRRGAALRGAPRIGRPHDAAPGPGVGPVPAPGPDARRRRRRGVRQGGAAPGPRLAGRTGHRACGGARVARPLRASTTHAGPIGARRRSGRLRLLLQRPQDGRGSRGGGDRVLGGRRGPGIGRARPGRRVPGGRARRARPQDAAGGAGHGLSARAAGRWRGPQRGAGRAASRRAGAGGGAVRAFPAARHRQRCHGGPRGGVAAGARRPQRTRSQRRSVPALPGPGARPGGVERRLHGVRQRVGGPDRSDHLEEAPCTRRSSTFTCRCSAR